jgi:hypothetical protein
VNEYARNVLVRDATIAVAVACSPPPPVSRHTTEVADIQLLVVHCAAPIESVGDVSAAPKFMPDTVSVEPPVVGPFTVPRDVKTGAAHSDKRSWHCMPHGAQRSYHHM